MMTTCRVAVSAAGLAVLLAACSQQDAENTRMDASASPDAQAPAPPARTEGADDADAEARSAGYASAAEEARARAYGGEAEATEVATAEDESQGATRR